MNDDPYDYHKRPVLHYIVLDQNCFRDQQVVEKALLRAREKGELIVLTEAALHERMKSKIWISYYGISLKGLSEFPDGVVGARSIGEMLEFEERSGVPQRNIVDDFMTSILRQHLKNLQSGPDQIMELNKIFATGLQNRMFNGSFYELNKAVLVGMVKDITNTLPLDLVKKFRQQDQKALINFLISHEVTAVCIDAIQDAGCSRDVAIMLAHEPSVSHYYFLTTLALSIKWIALGGIETVKAE